MNLDNKKTLQSIEQLLSSNTAANNYLALILLCQQVKMPFKTAFAKLNLLEQEENGIYGISQYQVQIAEYEIFFSVEHCWSNDKNFPYLAIRRLIKQANKRLKEYDLYVSIDYFESEKERDLYEALISLSNLSDGLEALFFGQVL